MLIRLFLLALLAYIGYAFWRRYLAQRRPPPTPDGFSPAAERLLRCDRCGVRVPASEIDTVRANCRQCGPKE